MSAGPKEDLEALEIQRAVEKIRSTPLRERAGAIIGAALNAIPYAGGSLAAILGSYAADRKIERIFETLDALCSAIREVGVKVDEVLTEDQVTELIDESLPRIATASSEEKRKFLRTGLIRSFTLQSLPYDTKHLLLKILGDLSYPELIVLRIVYKEADPYVETASAGDSARPSEVLSAYQSGPLATGIVVTRTFKEWRNDGAKPALGQYISKKLHEGAEIAQGVASRLDGAGLTALGPALSHSQYRVFEAASSPAQNLVSYGAYVSGVAVTPAVDGSGAALTMSPTHTKSPIEEARTPLGQRLMEFVA